jgi:hypothetical protein
MTAAPLLGEFEQIVLLAILRLDDSAYGVTIRDEIAACTDRDPSPGALYTTLDRMEEKGLVTSVWPADARAWRARQAVLSRDGEGRGRRGERTTSLSTIAPGPHVTRSRPCVALASRNGFSLK